MASEKEGSGLSISIHPLVVMSIADHYTRASLESKSDRVIGTVFGQQSGREVNILETFEIPIKIDKDGRVEMVIEAFEEDLKLFQEAYPTYELLGWYATGTGVRAVDGEFHKVIQNYNERPLLVMMNPNPPENARELPILIYEEQVVVSQSKGTTTEFVATPFEIRADEAERITVVHCAKAVSGETEGSSVVPVAATLIKAVGMLNERVRVLHTLLADIKAGKVKADHKLLRDIKGLCNRLPTMDSPEFNQDFVTEYNDALLVTYLAAVTKGTNTVNDVVDKFNLAHSRVMGRGGMGMGGGMGGGMSLMGMLGGQMGVPNM